MANTEFTYDKSLHAYHISTDLENYEAARNAFFTLVVDDLEGLVGLIKPEFSGELDTATESDKIAQAQEILKLNVTKAFVPHFRVNVEQYRRGNEVVKFATTPEWEGGNIEVDDIDGQDTKSILMAWLYKAYNPHTRKGGRMADYKKTCTLCEYSEDYELIRSWTLEGCFITKITEGDFDRENDGKRKLTAEISFDRAVINEK